MCGLVYVRRKDGKSASGSVRKRYFTQKLRGQSGFGYVAIKDNQVVSYQRAVTEHEIMNLLSKERAPEILFHHRLPTSTPNMEEQAHPLFVSNPSFQNQYYIAHNGIIRNASERKREHDKSKIEYLTEIKPLWETVKKRVYAVGEHKFNDSEALAVDTALALEGKAHTIDSEGASAVIGLKVQGTRVLERIVYRNTGNPLRYHTNQKMTTITSMGKGSEVEAVFVQKINDDGSLSEHELKIWSPWIYKSQVYNPIRPVELPVRTTTAPTVSYPKTIDLTFDYQDNDPPFLQEKEDVLLSNMTTAVLWEEYDKIKNGKDLLENSIARVEEKTGSIGLDNDTLDTWNRLMNRLTRLKAFEARIDAELLKREAILLPRNNK